MRQFVDNQKYSGVVHTASQVDEELSLGVWDVSREVDCDRNYWSYSCRLATLKNVVDACSEALLHHKFWDVCLVKCLTSCENFSTAFGTGEAAQCWMYLPRHDPDLDHSCAAPAGLARQQGFAYVLQHNLALYCCTNPSFALSG